MLFDWSNMEKVKINDIEYDIVFIDSIDKNIIKIQFKDSFPNEFNGSIEILTNGGIIATSLKGFDTIYKKEDKLLYLSNDGSVYKEHTEIKVSPYIIDKSKKVETIENKIKTLEKKQETTDLALAELTMSIMKG